jgi:hypothetical protein
VSEKDSVRPCPIGIEPEFVWIERRFWSLAGACTRYSEAGLPIRDEWKEEMRIHFGRMTSRSTGYDEACEWMKLFGFRS